MNKHLDSIIEAQLDGHYRYKSAVDEPWTYPSQAFEQKAGITGVSRDYAMPGNKDPKDIYIGLARAESEHEILFGYVRLAEEMGGLSEQNWQAHKDRLAIATATFSDELDHIKQTGSLDEVEDKVSEGYRLHYQQETLTGLRALLDAGCTDEQLTASCSKARQTLEQKYDATYDALESLNPELSILTPQLEHHGQKRWAVLGVLSKYNVADIKGFCIDGVTYREAQNDPKWVRQWEEVQERTGGELDGWIPAKSTLLRILDKLNQRDKAPATMAR